MTYVLLEKILHFLASPTAVNMNLAKWSTGMQGRYR